MPDIILISFRFVDPDYIIPNAEAFVITQQKNYSCINLTTVDDDIIESTRRFKVSLQERNQIPVNYLLNYDEIIFSDNDSK